MEQLLNGKHKRFMTEAENGAPWNDGSPKFPSSFRKRNTGKYVKKSLGFLLRNQQRCCRLSVGHSEVTVIAPKIIVAGRAASPHKAGRFLPPPQIAVALTHIQQSIVEPRQKARLLRNPLPCPLSSEPRRHQLPWHKGTKGRRRAEEQKTKPNMEKKKNTGGQKDVKSPGAFTGCNSGESGSKALAFRKAPSVYVRDEGR